MDFVEGCQAIPTSVKNMDVAILQLKEIRAKFLDGMVPLFIALKPDRSESRAGIK
jgi:hypothetical protein